MKFRKRPSPLLLLLLPSLATVISAAVQGSTQSTLNKNAHPRDSKLDPLPSPIVDLNTKSKYEIGTKDAPVDGKDGKPHAGPFVGTEKDPKKADSKDAEVSSKKDDTSELVSPTGEEIPLVNDGVMNDPSRELPKQGTTGTAGGVSEKDKARKAQEGQTGEKLEKRPDSPKEAASLPQSEKAKADKAKVKGEKTKLKEADDGDDHEGLAGLEVSIQL